VIRRCRRSNPTFRVQTRSQLRNPGRCCCRFPTNDVSLLAVADRPGHPRRQPRYEQTTQAGQVSVSGRWRPPTTVTTPPRSSTTGATSHAAAGGLQPLSGADQEGNGGYTAHWAYLREALDLLVALGPTFGEAIEAARGRPMHRRRHPDAPRARHRRMWRRGLPPPRASRSGARGSGARLRRGRRTASPPSRSRPSLSLPLCRRSRPVSCAQPPAIAPTISSGSTPRATAPGSG